MPTIKFTNRLDELPILKPPIEPPSINGVTLVGNKSAKELGILSILPENYEPVDIHNAAAKNGGIVIVGDDNSPMILSAQSILDRGTGFFTSEEIDGDVEIGVYQFVQKK